jgi:hypothetical protein
LFSLQAYTLQASPETAPAHLPQSFAQVQLFSPGSHLLLPQVWAGESRGKAPSKRNKTKKFKASRFGIWTHQKQGVDCFCYLNLPGYFLK